MPKRYGGKGFEVDTRRAAVLLNSFSGALNLSYIYRLAADTAVSSTSIILTKAIPGPSTDELFVLIGAFNNQAEFRKVEGISSTTYTVAALEYAHAEGDLVLWFTDSIINAKWFGAKGDDSTDDTTSLQRMIDQAKAVGKTRCYIPMGIYQSTGLNLSSTDYNSIILFGDGYQTQIKATAAGTMLAYNTGFAGGIERIALEGNNTATTGLYVGNVNQFYAKDIFIRYVDASPGRGLVLDRTQNAYFSNIYLRYNNDSMIVANGAANNAFYWVHASTDGSSPQYGLFIGPVSGLPEYVGDSSDNCLQNRFFGGLFERGEVTNALRIIDSHRTSFYSTDFFRGTATATPGVYIGSGSNQTRFVSSRFMNRNNTTEPLVNNLGNWTVFENCNFSNTPNPFDVIWSQDMCFVEKCYFDAGARIDVTSGNIYDGIGKVVPITGYAMPTASRPDYSEFYMDVYDTDYRKPYWHDGQADAWHDAINGRYSTGSPTTLTISGGTVTIAQTFHKIATQGGAATDDLDTITRANEIDWVILKAADGTKDVVCKNATGNLNLDGDCILSTAQDLLFLQWDSDTSVWKEIARTGHHNISARVYRTTSQTLTTAVAADINFTAERWDTKTIHDTVTNNERFTIPRDGIYATGGAARYDANGTGIRRLRLRLNGTTTIDADRENSPSTTAATVLKVGTQYQFVEGDYLTLQAYQTSGGDLDLIVEANNTPEFWITWLGPK